MNTVTLFRPGIDPAKAAINLDFAGDGIVLETVGASPPHPHYFASNQEAKEFIVKSAFALLHAGYRIFTGDGLVA